MKKQLLGIDIGTSACKVAIFDEDGLLLAQSTQPYDVYYPQTGWVEQDPRKWWQSVCICIRDVLSHDGVDKDNICAIGVDGQGWSAIPIDKGQNVLYNSMIWMDTRARDICDEFDEHMHEHIFEVAGNCFLPSYTTPKMLWLKRNRPEVFERTYKFLQSNSYIVMRLTGEISQDYSQGYGIHFFDISKLSYDYDLARQLGLSVDLVPNLFECDQIVGEVTKEAAEQTGLRVGTIVVAGGLDAACGALGAGVYDDGQTQEQGGQAGGMSICTSRPMSHKKLILGTHVVPGKWLLQGGTVGGGGTLKWFKRELGEEQSFDELGKMAAAVDALSDGMIFLPYMAGERSPIWNPDAKGVFYGLSYDKTKGHMVRALMEGVAYSLEHNLMVAAQTGVTVDSLNAMGGSANSYIWTQIKSDVTGKVINVPSSDTATTLGVALVAGVGCGLYKDYKEACDRTIKITRTHFPDANAHEKYEEGMQQYLRLYQQMEPLFEMK